MATFQALTNQPNGLTNISASDILSIGLAIVSGTGTPATSGLVRAANNTTIISARNTANSNNIPVIATDSSNQILIGDAAQTGGLNLSSSNQLNTISASVLIRDAASATAITIIPVPAGATSMTVAAGATSFIFSQSTKTSDAAPVNFTIRPQAPFSTATGANRVAGSLIADIAAPTNSGTSEGRLTITRASTFSASIGPYESAGSSYSAIYLGPGLTPSSSNFTVLSNGSSVTYLNAPSGGTIALSFNGATATGMILTANLLQWATATTTPLINQADVTTNSATGAALTLQSQNATGTTSTGGGLTLTSGTGTTVAGNLLLQTGGSTKLTVSPTLITAALPIVLQGTNSSASGDIRASKGFQFAARNQTNTGDNSVLFDDSSNGLIVGGSGYASSTLRAATTTATVTSGLITINGALVLQGTNPATTGDIRAANNTTIMSVRDAANSANLNVIKTDNVDTITVGQFSGTGSLTLDGAQSNLLRVGGSSRLLLNSTAATFFVPIILSGSNPATTGDIRAVNNTTIIAARNAGNSADIPILYTDASNNSWINGSNAALIGIGAVAKVTVTSTAFDIGPLTAMLLPGANRAGIGDMRAINNTTILAARNAANSADITVLKTDGSNQITIGDTTNTGAVFLTANSSTGTIRFHGTTIIGDPDTTARISITPGATTTMAVAASVTSFSLLQTTSATGNGVNMTIQAQSGLVDGNPRNGGKLILLGGAKNSTGLKGGLKLALNADVANEILIELVEIASSRRIVAINRGVPLTTTEMPSNTGDLVCYIGNASTVPSASPVSGGILYSDQGAGKWYGTSGTVTTFGPAEPHCPRCGRDYAFEAKNTRLNEHLAICWACFTDEAAAHGMNVSNFAFIRQLNES